MFEDHIPLDAITLVGLYIFLANDYEGDISNGIRLFLILLKGFNGT